MKIRRPGALVLSLYGAGIFFGKNCSIPIAGIALSGFTALAVLFIFWGRKRVFCGCLGILLLLGGVLNFYLHRDSPSDFVEEKEGCAWLKQEGEMKVEGMILSVERGDGDVYRAVVKTGREKVLLRVSGEQSTPWDFAGRCVMFAGVPRLPESARNPGTFDYRLYLRTQGIRTIFYLESSNVEVKETSLEPFRWNWVGNGISRIKGHFIDELSEKTSPETAGFLAGMVLGDASLLDEGLYEAFQKNGVAHIMAVSGLHTAVIYGCMEALLRRREKKLRILCIVLGLLFYGALSGFSVSVLRAMVMICLNLLAGVLHRRYDLISAACWTAVIFLVWNPYTLFNTGFLLSFTAVLSLKVVGGGMERLVKEKTERTEETEKTEKTGKTGMPRLGRILSVLAPLVGIQLGLAPLTAYCFNIFSPGAFIANIPIIFLAGIIIPMGIVLIPLSFPGGGFGVLFEGGTMALGVWIKWMEAANSLSGLGPLSFRYVPSPSLWMMAFYYMSLILIFSEVKFTLPGKKKACLPIFLLCAALCLPQGVMENHFRPQVVFVDVGQGDCIHIRTPDGKNILVDGGGSLDLSYDVGKKTLLPYLLKNGVSRIDGAIVTHMDADHYGGIASVSQEIPIDQFYFSGVYQEEKEVLREMFGVGEERMKFLWEGDALRLGEGIEMVILHPEKNQKLKEENEKSLVISLDYHGVQILLTGDIEKETELSLKLPKECDILKIPHHGSKTSSSEEFLSGLKPKAAVIQVGKRNLFGHPAPSVIERCEKKGIMVYRNDQDGAVSLWIKDGSFRLSSQLPELQGGAAL